MEAVEAAGEPGRAEGAPAQDDVGAAGSAGLAAALVGSERRGGEHDVSTSGHRETPSVLEGSAGPDKVMSMESGNVGASQELGPSEAGDPDTAVVATIPAEIPEEGAVEGIAVSKTFLCNRARPGEAEVLHPATIVRIRKDAVGEEEFYVHYVEMDRRLDEWVRKDRLSEELILPPPRTERKRKDRGSLSFHEEADLHSHRKRGRSDHAHFHEMTKVRNVDRVQLGCNEIACWYFSPYPGKFGSCKKLFICESTFKYFSNPRSYARYLETRERSNAPRGPPGRQIYRDLDRGICVFEIDGSSDLLFGQNLCLFGKLFIEHKTLSFDPAPFFFYVLYEEDADGLHPVGYFSKEKNSKEKYNLACIVTLPPYQRKGYGKFIISLSYEVTKKQGDVGSPEKPLSDLGRLSYRSYWTYVLLDLLDRMSSAELDRLSLPALAKRTGMKPDDILSTMQNLQMIHHLKGQFVIRVRRKMVAELITPMRERNFAKHFCKPELLKLPSLEPEPTAEAEDH